MRTAALAIALGLFAASASAGTTVLTAVRDNTIYSFSNFQSNGFGETMVAGRTGQGWLTRALVAFDLSSVPAGSTIMSATLLLPIARSRSGPEPMRVHRVLASWGEGPSVPSGGGGGGTAAVAGDATYSYRFYNTVFWTESGGDYLRTQSTLATVGDTGNGVWGPAPEIISDVQLWVNDPSVNFGWIVIGNEPGMRTGKAFGTRHQAIETMRPRLVIDFDTSTAARASTWGRLKAAYR